MVLRFCVFLVLLLYGQIFSQKLTDTVAYRSTQNPFYWKNKKPYEGYWQQDVKLKMELVLNDIENFIESKTYELTYYNNSPHELKEIYFHIHEQAFQPGSYYDHLVRENGIKPKYGKYESQKLGTLVSNISVDGIHVEAEFDNTVFRIPLPKALKTHDSIVIRLYFKTFFDSDGNLRRRMKMFSSYGYKHFDAVHFYPQVAVYDARCGWYVDQHLDKEFYNNFGSFEVSITLPAEYVVEATGVLINKDEVMPDSLRKKLDLANFKNKPFGEKPSEVTKRILDKNGSPAVKTWKFFATNVHNFVFTADPLYRIDEKEWNGIKIIALVQEPHASKWLPSASFAAKVVEIYSKMIGMYAWPKLIIADARDGMEYPMITLDNGTYPAHQHLLAHEIGHMWFYGMVANNETYKAFLDEGFTQFLTVMAMDSIVGGERKRIHPNKWITKFLSAEKTRYERLYYPYLRTVHDDRDEVINTHSHYFNGAIRHGGSYGLVYYKTGVMLDNLRWLLGDSLFWICMRNYFEKWKFCNPYPEDFRNTVIEVCQTDLNWFFDQWIETTKTIDYGIVHLRSRRKDTIYVTQIKIKRYGRMHMPLELTLTAKSGKKYHYYIPNTWFEKKQPYYIKTLPKWYGWDLLNPTYTIPLNLKEKIVRAEIDTSRILADIDRSNNVLCKKIPRRGSKFSLDHGVPTLELWDNPMLFWRPDIWYNGVDGLQCGLFLRQEYFKNLKESELILWLNSGFLKRNDQLYELKNRFFIEPAVQRSFSNVISYDIRHKRKTKSLGKFTHITVCSRMNAGILTNKVVFDKKFQQRDNRNPNFYIFSISVHSLYRFDNRYFIYPSFFSLETLNNFLEFKLTRHYLHYSIGKGELNITLRNPFLASDFNYNFFQIENKHYNTINNLEFKVRFFGRWGIEKNNTPVESKLYVTGGNPEEMQENKFYRAMGIEGYSFFYQEKAYHFSGGLNIRNLRYNQLISGISGVSTNLEIDFDKFFTFLKKKPSIPIHIDFYCFSDIGLLAHHNNFSTMPILYAAGLGGVLNILFKPLKIEPLTIRVDFPLLQSHLTEKSLLQPGLIFGFNKLF
jgi:aminopeptidase N